VDIHLSLDFAPYVYARSKKQVRRKGPIMDTSNEKDMFEGVLADTPSVVPVAPTEQCNHSDGENLLDRDSYKDSILLQCQPLTGVYWNGIDQVVIRQQNWDNEEVWVLFNRNNVPTLIARLQQMLNDDQNE
jgi:hypothetical protein